MKRVLLIPAILISCLILYENSVLPESTAQRRRQATPSKFAKFTHKSHTGQVKSLINNSVTLELNCAYCHGDADRDKQDVIVPGYPNLKNGLSDLKTHSACNDCHSFAGASMQREMCTICHESLTINPQRMAANIRKFPNPSGGGVSEFYDYFSHGEHVDYYDNFITGTSLKSRIKFYDPKQDASANKGLDKNRFECSACHTANNSPVTVAGIEFTRGVKMSDPGHPDCFVCHFDENIIAPPKKEKPSPTNTYATNCTGCHRDTGRPLRNDRPMKGSELAVLWFARQIINTELNPKNPAVRKQPLPFSHKTHDENVGKTVQDCLSCHATGKTAITRSEFYIEDRKTGQKQPLPDSCIECHKREMQTRIGDKVTLENSKCNYCHSLKTIKEYGSKGVQLPPENHFAKKALTVPAATQKPPTN